jgi:hypothetical protein
MAAVRAGDDVVECVHVEVPMPFRGLVGASQLGRGNGLGEVQERSGHRGNRDSVDLGAVVGVERGTVNRDPGPAPATGTGGGRVNRPPVGLPKIPEHGGIAMA